MLLHQRFLERWGAAALVGSPPPAPALASAQLQHFAWRHQVGAGDTLARIAVKYGTTTASVKRLNNLMTDHSLATRDAVYIAGAGWLCGWGVHGPQLTPAVSRGMSAACCKRAAGRSR